jgi:arginase
MAPGVSHREPGGLTIRQAIDIIHSLRGDVVGADFVEFNPGADPTGLTASVSAKLVKELAARMLVGIT